MSENPIEAAISDMRDLPIRDVRRIAATQYGLNITKEMEKDDIFQLIRTMANKADFALAATGDMPKPGWARITLHKVPGRSHRPEYFGVNGYRCTVPKGHEVDVPIKVYQAIKNCKRKEFLEDPSEPINGNRRWKWETMDVHSVTLHALTPGPDPRPGHERTKTAKLKPYLAFFNRYGWYPKPSEVKAAITNGQLDGFRANEV